jgi:hypothetical protein
VLMIPNELCFFPRSESFQLLLKREAVAIGEMFDTWLGHFPMNWAIDDLATIWVQHLARHVAGVLTREEQVTRPVCAST